MVYRGTANYTYQELEGFYDHETLVDDFYTVDGDSYDIYELEEFYNPAYADFGYEWVEPLPAKQRLLQPDGIVFAAVGFVIFLLIALWASRGAAAIPIATLPVTVSNPAPVQAVPAPLAPPSSLPAPLSSLPADAFIAPYTDYILTQGLHGFDYGHMAIDIKAGESETILSPIAGTVTALYVDGLGNTTLVIENDFYQVTLLHGLYTVAVGDHLESGQSVGSESNQGNTVDSWGNSCRGRPCGHHTHLNVFDKRLGSNVDPLELIHTFAP